MNKDKENGLTRRDSLKLIGAGAAIGLIPIPFSHAGDVPDGFTRSHGFSVFGDLALPKDFTHLRYVNPNAPKIGKLIITPQSYGFNQTPSTFDTFNGLINKNEAPANIDSYLFTTLISRNLDEADSVYGLLAESIDISDDNQRLRFNLRDFATFADGSNITADDVVFSYEILREKGHFLFPQILEKLVSIKALSPAIVEMTLKEGTANNEILSIISMPILSKAFYTKHDFSKADLTKPLASGSYTVGNFEPSTYIEYERRIDAWEDRVPIAKGLGNFKTVRVEMYRDPSVAFEAFKAKQYLIRYENISQTWMTEYDFPAVKNGEVKQEVISDDSPTGSQGIFINLRRDKFKDIRVRQAISLMFDFEWMNENYFFGQYTRTQSLFQNTPYMAAGVASEYEKQLLAPYLDELPTDILDEPWQASKTRGDGRLRRQIGEAIKLLDAAGWTLENGVRVNEKGERFEIEIPYFMPSSERINSAFAQNLEKIGIILRPKRVDQAQFGKLRRNFDYDLMAAAFGFGLTPTQSITQFWESKYVNQTDSRNLSGIQNPILDALSKNIATAKTREELNDSLKVIDRIWRVNYYWIPNYYLSGERTAYWDIFDRPSQKPKYGTGVSAWWWNEEKAAKIL